MGLFMGLSGVIGAEADEVKKALSDFARGRKGGFEMAEGTIDDEDIGIISHGGPNTTVMYPGGFDEWDEASQYLSERLARPVFSFHIHDEDLWMFTLFQDGKEIDWFNQVPEYWGELSTEEKEQWKGDASLIAEVIPSVSAEAISKYLVEWDLDDEDPPKAYPDDEFTHLDCWQMCDFMKKVGLECPRGEDDSVHGDTFRFWTKQEP